MKKTVPIILFCVITTVLGFLSCSKSNSPSNGKINKSDVNGNWAGSFFLDATTSNQDTLALTLYPDTVQLNSSGKFVAWTYTESFDPNLMHMVWTKAVDSNTYNWVNDSAFVLGTRHVYNYLEFGNDTFYVRKADAHTLVLFSPDSRVGGGYYYGYTKY